ncbi:aminomethyltransferase [Cutibacterium acnes JCM 18918]|nr:aminomethyltransferase [Cutibacterium acnes JCM 18918]
MRYSSDLAEHHAVRKNAGIFDLSHMGEIRISGLILELPSITPWPVSSPLWRKAVRSIPSYSQTRGVSLMTS